VFVCDEYQHFATVSESEPTGDEKFFSLSREPKNGLCVFHASFTINYASSQQSI